MYSKMVLAEVDKLWSSTQLLAHQKTVTQADAGLGCKLSGGFLQGLLKSLSSNNAVYSSEQNGGGSNCDYVKCL